MIEVQTVEQLNIAIRKLRAEYDRGIGTVELIRALDIDPVTQLRGGDWRGSDFASCDLRGVDFSNSRLAFCDFTDADVAGAVFYDADLFRSTLHRALNLPLAYLDPRQRHYLEERYAFDMKAESDEGRTFQINQKIRAATSFDRAKKQFESISLMGSRPDQYSAGLLMSRAHDANEAWEAFEIITQANCPINEIVFTTFASKMKSSSEIRKIMRIMHDKNLPLGIRIYNTLISRTKDYGDIGSVIKEMAEFGILWDNVTYSILMRRADFDWRKRLFWDLVNQKLRPRVAELNILISGARNEEEADESIEIANELEIGRDWETYAFLAPYKLRSSAWRTFTDDMIEDDVARDVEFYALALSKVETFSGACFLIGKMKADAVAPDARIYDRLVHRAGIRPEQVARGQVLSLDEMIASLILRVGTSADIDAAGL